MAAILAALKSLAVLFDFIKWAAEFVRGLIVESKKQHAEKTHNENQNAINAAFPAAAGGVPIEPATEPSAADAGASAIPSGKGGGSGLG